jgi:hypothetical protein
VPELFESGIHTENSDIRAHVSVVNRKIYVFRTPMGIAAIERLVPEKATASQPGVGGITAQGWKLPWDAIEDIRIIHPCKWTGWALFRETMTTTEKGRLAVQCVQYAMKCGRFPLWVCSDEDDRESVQIKGTDILLFCRKRIQVKCDWRCGERPAGTGNLFLQCAERNPLRRY